MGSRTTKRRLCVRNAGLSGRGVFAKSKIPKGQVVLSFPGEATWIWDIAEELWEHTFQVDYDRYIVPRRGSYGWFLNHSCVPNCGILGRASIVAIRNIPRGEEITIDYSTNVGWDGFAMDCRCGETSCRRMIRSYNHLTDDRKAFFGRNVSHYLLEPKEEVKVRNVR